MSRPPTPPGRSEVMYRLRPSLEIAGRLSSNGELTTGPRLTGVPQGPYAGWSSETASAATAFVPPRPASPLSVRQPCASATHPTSSMIPSFGFIAHLFLGLARDPDRDGARQSRVVAKSARAVVAPAIGDTSGGQSAGVVGARADCGESESPRYEHRRARTGGRSCPQLPERVISPAQRHIGRGHATRIRHGRSGRRVERIERRPGN